MFSVVSSFLSVDVGRFVAEVDAVELDNGTLGSSDNGDGMPSFSEELPQGR